MKVKHQLWYAFTCLIDDILYNSVSKGGIFTCSVSVLVRLDPSEKATFSLLNTAPVKEGDVVTMKCETDGNPQPEFDFTKDVRVHFSLSGGERAHFFVVFLILLH